MMMMITTTTTTTTVKKRVLFYTSHIRVHQTGLRFLVALGMDRRYMQRGSTLVADSESVFEL
jgi:hypothetical protein